MRWKLVYMATLRPEKIESIQLNSWNKDMDFGDTYSTRRMPEDDADDPQRMNWWRTLLEMPGRSVSSL